MYLRRSLFGLLLLAAPLFAAAPPSWPTLTAEQRERLRERDRLLNLALGLKLAGLDGRAAEGLRQVLAIEREVFGDRSEPVAATLHALAGLNENRDRLAEALKARREVLAVRTALYGPEDWRVVDATWEASGWRR